MTPHQPLSTQTCISSSKPRIHLLRGYIPVFEANYCVIFFKTDAFQSGLLQSFTISPPPKALSLHHLVLDTKTRYIIAAHCSSDHALTTRGHQSPDTPTSRFHISHLSGSNQSPFSAIDRSATLPLRRPSPANRMPPRTRRRSHHRSMDGLSRHDPLRVY